MDVDQLRGLYWTAKLKSFTAAAKKLYLTQPAVSLQVKALERHVGGKLLERVGRTIRLTHTGEVLFVQAEELMGKLNEPRQFDALMPVLVACILCLISPRQVRGVE